MYFLIDATTARERMRLRLSSACGSSRRMPPPARRNPWRASLTASKPGPFETMSRWSSETFSAASPSTRCSAARALAAAAARLGLS